jgi:DNA-binding MarR family transcriptional regulator
MDCGISSFTKIMPSSPSISRKSFSPARRAFRSLLRVEGLMRRIMEPYFARMGITGAQWGILYTLHCGEDGDGAGVRLTDLSQRLLVRPPSITTLVDRLERLGMVSRGVAAGDQRAKFVSLTRAGRSLIIRQRARHGRHIEQLMSGLSAAEQGELHRLLERMAGGMESLTEETPAASVD